MMFSLQFKNDYAKLLHRALPATNNKYIIIHRQKDSLMSAHFFTINDWSTAAHFFLASHLSVMFLLRPMPPCSSAAY